MDCVLEISKNAAFIDVDFVDDTPRRMGFRRRRGIVVVDGIQCVAATDYAMAVCCHDLALFLLHGR
jgi:hypothetical protein